MSELTKVYEQIALERDHVCTGCGTNQSLSHSHLVPKSQNSKLKCVKKNIVYHCLSRGEIKGCHTIWESVEFWTLDDAYQNMVYIFSVDPTYFWLKLNHAIESYAKQRTYILPIVPSSKEERDLLKKINKALQALELIKKIADEKSHTPA